jgi:hypothetical protein
LLRANHDFKRSDEKMKVSHIACRIRPVGWLLLGGGCLALAYFFVNVSGPTHTLWIWHCQHLPEGDMISRSEAASSLREFQLKANWIFRRMVLLPTAAMFVGGIILAIGRKQEEYHNNVLEDIAANAPNPQD